MKPTFKIGSLLLAAVMACSAIFASGCSFNKEWSYKTSDKELAIGVYIYTLDLAFQQGQTFAKKLDDYDATNDKWFDLEITDDDGNTAVARQWMKDKAQEMCLEFLAVEKALKDEGATPDEATLTANKQESTTYWNVGPYAQYGQIMPMSKTLEPYGISYESFEYCTAVHSANYSALFDAVYGAGGSQEVTDEELSKFFVENYADYSYIPVQLYESTTDDDGQQTSTALSEDKIKELTDELEGYVSDINGGKNMDDVDKAYTEKHELAQSAMVSNVEQLESFSAGDDLKTAYEKLDSGKATTVKVGEGETAMLYLLYKKDINETAKTYFESASNRSTVLAAMKTDDFKKYVEGLAKDLDYDKNNAVETHRQKRKRRHPQSKHPFIKGGFMSRHIKLLSVIMAAIMGCAALSIAPVFAETDSSMVDPVAPEMPDEPDDPVQPDVPDFTEVPDSPSSDPEPYNPPYTPDDDGGSGSGGGGGYNPSGSQSSWNGYDDNDNNNNTETFYVGGGQTYIPPKATAPSAALYNSEKKNIDDKELNKNDWSDIASRLKNTGNANSSEDDGSGDFNFIQKNTAKEDNGHWIIIAGVLCLLLSVTGFIYLIASAISRRRRLMNPTAGSSQGYYRSDSDYDDGYQGGKKEKTPKNGRRYK